jgi:hypothetical protein
MEIDLITETVFREYPDGMYFDEFVEFSEQISSEFVYAIFDTLYQCVPCIKNFFHLRHNFRKTLMVRTENSTDSSEGPIHKPHTLTVSLAPPLS